MNHHDHIGPWWQIGVGITLLFVAWWGTFMGTQHQFNVIYDRVREIQRQLECPPTEVYVTDLDGNEYCVDVAEHEGGQ